MTAKKVALNIIKVIAGISAVVFWLVPLRYRDSTSAVRRFYGRYVDMLSYFSQLGRQQTGYWPSNPEDSTLVSKIPPGAAGRTTSPEQPNITKPNTHG